MWYQSSKNNPVDTFQSRWITQRLIGYMLAGSDWACSHNCLSQLELRTDKSCHFFNNHSLLYNVFLSSPLKRELALLSTMEKSMHQACTDHKENDTALFDASLSQRCSAIPLTVNRSTSCSAKFMLGKGGEGQTDVWSASKRKKYSLSKFGSTLPNLLPLIKCRFMQFL